MPSLMTGADSHDVWMYLWGHYCTDQQMLFGQCHRKQVTAAPLHLSLAMFGSSARSGVQAVKTMTCRCSSRPAEYRVQGYSTERRGHLLFNKGP